MTFESSLIVESEESVHGTVAVFRLNRPFRANSYDPELLHRLEAALDAWETKAQVLLIEASGSGAFCGGADRKAWPMARAGDALDLQSQRIFHRIARSPLPSVVAIHGPAVAGGMELTLACDIRVVGPQARISLPETGLGLLPAAGGTSRLPGLVGGSIARQMILLGRSLSAEEAASCGLALGPHADVHQAAREVARQLLARDPLSLRLARQLLWDGDEERRLLGERLAEAVLYEARAQRPKG